MGIQFDIEGSAQFRSTGSDLLEFESTDVRFGFPVSIGWGSQETKLALYFLRAGTDQRRPHASSARQRKFGILLDAAFELAKPIPKVSLEPGRTL